MRNLKLYSSVYLQDCYSGTTCDKPTDYPDTLQIENQAFMAVLNRGNNLADTLFDYTENGIMNTAVICRFPKANLCGVR